MHSRWLSICSDRHASCGGSLAYGMDSTNVIVRSIDIRLAALWDRICKILIRLVEQPVRVWCPVNKDARRGQAERTSMSVLIILIVLTRSGPRSPTFFTHLD